MILVLVVLALFNCDTPAAKPPSTPSPFEDPTIPTWQIQQQPELRLGGEDERAGYFFDGVRGAALLAGRLVVADGGSHEIRFYDLTGNLLTRAGRAGIGPGEYRSIGGIAPVGDTAVVVWDRQLRRCTFLQINGKIIRTVNPDLSEARQIVPAFVGAFPSGELVFRDAVSVMSLSGEVTGERRDPAVLLVLSPDGAWAGSSRQVPGTETTFFSEGNVWGIEPVIFGRSTFQTVAGARLTVASNDSLTFLQLDASLTERAVAGFTWQPRSVSRDDIENERRQRLREARASSTENPSRSFIDGRPIGEVLLPAAEGRIEAVAARNTEPAFAELHGDREGNTWVASFTKRTVPERWWLILDPELMPVGRLQLPTGLRVLAVSRDLIVSLRSDALGRETVELFRIRRPA